MNDRKRYVKCVDCGCQTLPKNAHGERPWASAACLYVHGRVNEGALCFTCANRRRGSLRLPIEQEADSACAPGVPAGLRKVTINNQEYIWDATTLDSLITKWKDKQLDERFRNLGSSWWLVVVNDRSIPTGDFRSVPISDGDEISIVLGRGRYF